MNVYINIETVQKGLKICVHYCLSILWGKGGCTLIYWCELRMQQVLFFWCGRNFKPSSKPQAANRPTPTATPNPREFFYFIFCFSSSVKEKAIEIFCINCPILCAFFLYISWPPLLISVDLMNMTYILHALFEFNINFKLIEIVFGICMLLNCYNVLPIH